MRIDHIALYVNELEEVKAFLSATSGRFPMRCIIIRGRGYVRISCRLVMGQGWKSCLVPI